MTAYIVAVSGMSGSGKTSVIQRASGLLGDAVVLHFDEYIETSTYPPDLKDWLDRGADVDEWKTPRLAADVRALREGGARFVLLEEPFGRMRRELRDLIDLAVHLDVPADILLARRLLRRLEEERHQGEKLLDRVQKDLNVHLATGRELEIVGAAAGKAAADVVLDGTRPLDDLAQELVSEIRARHR